MGPVNSAEPACSGARRRNFSDVRGGPVSAEYPRPRRGAAATRLPRRRGRDPSPRNIDPRTQAAHKIEEAVRLRMAGQLQTLALPIFASFDAKRLTLFTQKLRVASFEAGEKIFAAGDQGRDFYILLQGEVRVTEDETDVILATLTRKGSYFGELALIRHEPRTATCVSMQPTTLAVVPGAAFSDLFLDSPAASADFEIKALREQASAGAVLSHPATGPAFKKFLDGDFASENHASRGPSGKSGCYVVLREGAVAVKIIGNGLRLSKVCWGCPDRSGKGLRAPQPS